MLDRVAANGLNSLIFSRNLGSVWATVSTIEMAESSSKNAEGGATSGDRDVGVDLSQISTNTTYLERPERTPLC